LSNYNPKIRILGRVPYAELPQFYQNGDISCLPSTWETVPTSILEAMACGLPIIATDVGGITEIVNDGETGLIVPSRDCDALTNALTTRSEDTDKRIEMGKKARKNAEKFEWEKVTDAFLRVYEKVMR
jgi:glycosyltransferase involved in cell wall biosynthesis